MVNIVELNLGYYPKWGKFLLKRGGVRMARL